MRATPIVLVTVLVLLVAPLFAGAAGVPPGPSDPLPGPGDLDPSGAGAWAAPFEGQVPAITMTLMEDGRVLYWGGIAADDHDHVFFFDQPHVADVAVLAPPYTAADVTVVPNPPGMGDLFCAGVTVLPDGRVLAAGGSDWKRLGEDNTGFVDGASDTWTFDAATTSWTREGDMAVKRWYPTLITRADGQGLAVSGIEHLPQPQTLNTLVESFADPEWETLEGADRLLPMYPRLFTVPSGPLKGDVFYATSGTLWGPFGEHPAEAQWSLEQALDLDTNAWTTLGPSVFGARQHAGTVMLPLSPDDDYTARILTFGGSIGRSLVATNLVEMTTLGETRENEALPPLDHPRWHANGVLLPDGSVLAVGGGLYDNVYVHGQPNVPVLVAERYVPGADAWEQLAPMSVARMYHSTSLLLPDGRVLVGGHVPLPAPWKDVREGAPYQEQVVETRFEVFEPPYLHWGVARPVIAHAPASVAFGATFTVDSPDAARVVDAVLVKPGATTHAWDANQRVVGLDVVSRGETTLTFQAPPDGDVATPGPWMLFLRVAADEGLVPGEAVFVRLG